jgi:transcription-repair coupling factor (superfamily II helicase)
MQMLDEAVEALSDEPADDREPVRFDVHVDAYVPADYIPYEQAKIDVHRRIAAAREVSEIGVLADELEDRFGPVPEPMANLLSLQQARIKFGLCGAKAVALSGDRLSITPIELTAPQAKEIKQQFSASRYEPGRSQVSFALPKENEERFVAIRQAADGLLAASAGAAAVSDEVTAEHV